MPDPSGAFLPRARADVDRRLSELLEMPARGAPPRLIEAARWAVLGAGKRLRGLLVIASGEACLPDPPGPGAATALLDAACAIEMIHAFSLVHDDLPALDDDDLRRGRPTVHVRFDEATAILTGDALLSLAFDILCRGEDRPAARLRALRTVTGAVGLDGMIAGQMLDLEAEGSAVDDAALHRIHELKTGALIAASCAVGGIVAGGSDDAVARLERYGTHLGLAFQIIDDILDVEGSAEELGKSPGKDAKAGKATFPALWGLEESRRRAADSVENACRCLDGLRAGPLIDLARGVLTRKR